MAPHSIFESFLVSQGYALFESLGEGEFLAVGDCPSWCRDILDLTSQTEKPIALANNSPFLENFLVDAEDFWNSKTEGAVNSGNWTERDKNGREVPLEAFALSLDNKKILILQNLSAHFAEQQQWFQTARDSLLAHEQLLSEIQKKEILLHCIVHDLSQPLTAITGCFNLLRLEKVPPVVEKYVEAGLRESQRQESMIRGILSAFSGDLMAQQASGHSGGAVPDLSVCARLALEEFSSAFKDKDVRLRFSPPPHDPADWRVIGDAPRLDRIIGNLLENTLRYSPPKSTVTIGLEDQGGYVLAFVDDEGPGLPKDLPANQLFALFSKGKSHSGKAGLGLYFCKITVERWGGTIGAETRAQGGSRFWFRLPRAEKGSRKSETPAPEKHSPAEHAKKEKPARRLRILVADDADINRELLIELLEKRGHIAIGAKDGREAVAELEKHDFDVLLVDEEMPHMTGLQATRAIRERETGTTRHQIIIGISGHVTEEDEQRFRDGGMDAILAKPVHMQKLYEIVESTTAHVGGSRAVQAAQVAPATRPIESSAAPNTAPTSSAAGDSVAYLERSTGGNKKLMASLVAILFADAPKALARIGRAIAQNNSAEVAAAAHLLKGSLAIFGASKAVESARSLEAMGKTANLRESNFPPPPKKKKQQNIPNQRPEKKQTPPQKAANASLEHHFC